MDFRYALCNETFAGEPFEQAWPLIREIGYTGIEIAPFTLFRDGETIDVSQISSDRRQQLRQLADDTGLEVVGLHWLLAKTEGFYLTSPDQKVRQKTADYLIALAELCGDLGGKVMVLGSPQQRNLLAGVSYADGEKFAAEVLRQAMPTCEARGVTIALEPLSTAEGDFMTTAAEGVQLAKLVDSPNCRLHLDVKAMSAEVDPIADVIRANAEWLEHFHANDPNLLGPGMGEVEFAPIFDALREIAYGGWVSVEVFRYEPSPEAVARTSFDNMQETAGS